jgi:hypothetical protein
VTPGTRESTRTRTEHATTRCPDIAGIISRRRVLDRRLDAAFFDVAYGVALAVASDGCYGVGQHRTTRPNVGLQAARVDT